MYRPETVDEVTDKFMEEVRGVVLKMGNVIEETRKSDPDPERTAAHRCNLILKEWHMNGLNMGY